MFRYRKQEFSLPDPIIYYLTKNPSTPKCYKKLIKTCKYFFAKNSILIVHCLQFNDDGWSYCIECNSSNKTTNYKNLSNFQKTLAKIWVINKIRILPSTMAHQNVATWLNWRLFKHETIMYQRVYLQNQAISFKDLFYYSLCFEINIENISVKCEDGSEASMEAILNVFTNVKIFAFNSNIASIYTPKTVENLLKIPHFSNIYTICFHNISGVFDINKFYEYSKKNKNFGAILCFNDSISDEYRNRLVEIVDELVQFFDNPEKYIPLVITFPGHDIAKIIPLLDNFIKWTSKSKTV